MAYGEKLLPTAPWFTDASAEEAKRPETARAHGVDEEGEDGDADSAGD